MRKAAQISLPHFPLHIYSIATRIHFTGKWLDGYTERFDDSSGLHGLRQDGEKISHILPTAKVTCC
jgi:hypothetical protein